MNQFMLLRLRYYAKFHRNLINERILIHISNIKLLHGNYLSGNNDQYYISLSNPELVIGITQEYYNKLFAMLCGDLEINPHKDFFIEGNEY